MNRTVGCFIGQLCLGFALLGQAQPKEGATQEAGVKKPCDSNAGEESKREVGANCAAAPAKQRRDAAIRVTFGEPNVWSLDQAHYLLEQRFQRNQSLEATRPGSDELNANAVNGNRFTAVRQLLQASMGFDQNAGATNEMARHRMQEDLALRPERRSMLDQSLRRQAELGAAMRQLAEDPGSYTAPKADGTKPLTEEAKAKNAALAAQMEAEKRVGETYKESLADKVPTAFVKPDLQVETKSMSGAVLDLLKDKLAFGDPKLAASNAVDNYVNLQNEMIMKQVTLLRNEAGLNRRIVFAEIPQDFVVDGSRWYAKRAENKLVRVQWKLKGYMYIPLATKRSTEKQGLQSEGKDDVLLKGFLRRWLVECTSALACKREQHSKQFEALLKEYKDDDEAREAIKWLTSNARYSEVEETGGSVPAIEADSSPRRMPFGTLRTIDLVPRQSSLNVNDRHYASNSINLSGMFRLLSGLGGNVNYQRQKETYEQYINQEVFATSFGKGTGNFGWTFGPNPGTKSLSPGQRTTYAVFSVPANALAVMLTAKACIYDRRDRFDEEQDCEDEVKFAVPIPGEFESGFWLDEVRYVPALAGSRTIVHLKGRHFSTLTGVVVNGTPLRRAVGLAAPYMAAPTPGGSGEVEGEYEMRSPDKIVLSFRMSPTFTGTPVISLVTPVKARFINDLPLEHVRVGERGYPPKTKLMDPKVMPMFYPKPEIKAVRWRSGNELIVEGTGLYRGRTQWAKYYWNGEYVAPKEDNKDSEDPFTDRIVLPQDPSKDWASNAELRLEFEPKFGIAPVRHSVANPGALRISQSTVVKFTKYKAATKENEATPGAVLVELQGTGFQAAMSSSVELSHGAAVPRVSVVSDTKALVWFKLDECSSEASFAVITLSRPSSSQSVSSYVVLAGPKEAPEDDSKVTETSTTVKRVPKEKDEKKP